MMESINIVTFAGKEIKVINEPVENLKDDEVLCQTLYSVVSIGSEIFMLQGLMNPRHHSYENLSKPCTYMGYSSTVKILDVGKNADGFKPGDIVFARGPHKQYFNIKAADLSQIPEGIPYEHACWLTVLRAGMYSAMKAEVKTGDTVAVIGVGIFGLSSIIFARMFGAKKIIAIDPAKKRLEIALKMGATHTFAGLAQDVKEEVIDSNGGDYCDSAVDASGKPETLTIACELTRGHGNIAVISDTVEIDKQTIGQNILTDYLNIHGIHIDMLTRTPNAFFPLTERKVHAGILNLMLDGRINMSDMITSIVSPVNAVQLYSDLVINRYEEAGILFDWRNIG
jgi:threonine dehydrogenase-like Zn-dependent dehydrogenase